MKNATMAPMIAIRMMIPSRPTSRDRVGSGGGAGLGAGVGGGASVGLGEATTTGVTTTWIAVFGLPFVMTGTPAALRQVAPSSPTSAVTT